MREFIGKFRVEKLIGEGATSKIYLAKNPFNDEEVAIKVARQQVFKDPVHGEHFRKMFMNEAGLAGKLAHPHIVNVLDAGIDNEENYIIMELVEGRPLRDYCKADNLLEFAEIVEVVYKCCDALGFAFKHGVIHRDVKPANIMVLKGRNRTQIKIADFGAAFRLDADIDSQITETVGSPAYMAPEILTGAAASHQGDIYALGVVLYQLLTAKLPYEPAETSVLIQRILNDEPTPITEYRSDIPSTLQYILKRTIAKNPKKRYQDWQSFANDLITIQDDLPAATQKNSDTARFNRLKSLTLFENFSDAELWELLKFSQWREFPARSILIKEGRRGQSLYVLVSGEAKVTRKEVMLGLIEAGESFGEISFISASPRTASVITTKTSMIIKLDAEKVKQSSERMQMLMANAMLHLLAKRLERTSAMVMSP